MIWLEFIISAGIILIAGSQLTRYADRLSDALGLGKVWIGVVLLGLVTSLPEAGASLVSVIGLDAADLAVGNMAGSNNFNLLLVVLLDLVYRRGSLTNSVVFNRAQAVTAAFALGLAGIAAVEIMAGGLFTIPTLFVFSPGSLLLIVIYLLGMRRIYQSNLLPAIAPGDRKDPGISLSRTYLGIFISGAVVIAGAVWVARSADVIAVSTGWGRTFVGSLFLALATSLPEMVVTLSALRLKQVDLAVGNIFGSNMTNMFLLVFCDWADGPGALLNGVSSAHVFTIFVGFAMTLVVILGLAQNKKENYFGLGWDSWSLILIYAAGMTGLYGMGR
ncbi:MAG: sodium:calcium antiporter [Candidatus Omnitrophota bacterium]